jgi:hypothetical protein
MQLNLPKCTLTDWHCITNTAIVMIVIMCLTLYIDEIFDFSHFCRRAVMMGGKHPWERVFNLLACMSGGSSSLACDEAHELRCKTLGAGECCHVTRCILPFQKPFWILRRSGVAEHAFAFSVYVVLDASYRGSVRFWEYRVAWWRFGVVSLVLHEINVSDPALAAPSGYSVCLRVAGCQNCSEVWCHRAGRSFLFGCVSGAVSDERPQLTFAVEGVEIDRSVEFNRFNRCFNW